MEQLTRMGTIVFLICHALTGIIMQLVLMKALKTRLVESPDWSWQTDRYRTILRRMPAVLGASGGTTGPTSQTPDSLNQTYGMDFPDFTIKDMINAQKALLDHLGVNQLEAVIGGSMGGMQALQ